MKAEGRRAAPRRLGVLFAEHFIRGNFRGRRWSEDTDSSIVGIWRLPAHGPRAGGVGKRDEQPTGIALQPVQLKTQRTPAEVEMSEAEAFEGHRHDAARSQFKTLRSDGLH